MAALGGVYLLSSVFHIATRPVCCGVEAAVFVFGQQDFADVFAGLLVGDGVDIVEVDVDSFAKAVNEFNIKYCEEKGWTDVYNKIVG